MDLMEALMGDAVCVTEPVEGVALKEKVNDWTSFVAYKWKRLENVIQHI
jgi:hypothetical protein